MEKSFHRTVSGKKYVNIGDVVIVKPKDTVWTVLGSCVSIIFYSRSHKLAMICHAQLPEKKSYDKACSDVCPQPCYRSYDSENDLRYVSCAFRFMLNRVNRLGINKSELKVHVYGGASIFNLETKSGKHIGAQNVEVAIKMLKKEGISINHKDVGGHKGRRIVLDGETGSVLVERHK